ncbi:hypothetical protein, partial [uncultured Desulfovibrio sp.]|uniref:hypothetical protein n=1 Tax=uncultured Desulfovibrio sp. TaxID=167968 RepID=UPI002805626A
MSALAAMKVIQQLCAAFCVYVASLGPLHRGAAFIFYHQVAVSGLFMEVDMAKGKGMDAKDFVNKYGLDVEGYLDLRGTQITALPDNLTVGGSLDLEGTQITALPDNLTVGG